MRPFLKPTLTKAVILLALFLACNVNIFSLVIANGVNEAFEEPITMYSTMEATETIESLIIKSAGYFLDANAQYLTFLNRIELTADPSQANYLELQSIIKRSIEKMTQARNTYESLVAKTEATSYNSLIIDRLINFDYDLFKRERALQGTAIDRIQRFFQKGDVRGAFSGLFSDSERILKGLSNLKGYVDAGKFPLMNDLWRLNQQFSETMLFGQYGAEIFYKMND